MKLSEAFPSNFLKASDITDDVMTVTIKDAAVEQMGKGKDAENKLILSFRGMEKKLVCNKTNAATISKVIGSDDTDDWIGQRINLVVREVEFQGDITMGIRVSLQKPAGASVAKPKAPISDNDGGPDEEA